MLCFLLRRRRNQRRRRRRRWGRRNEVEGKGKLLYLKYSNYKVKKLKWCKGLSSILQQRKVAQSMRVSSERSYFFSLVETKVEKQTDRWLPLLYLHPHLCIWEVTVLVREPLEEQSKQIFWVEWKQVLAAFCQPLKNRRYF